MMFILVSASRTVILNPSISTIQSAEDLKSYSRLFCIWVWIDAKSAGSGVIVLTQNMHLGIGWMHRWTLGIWRAWIWVLSSWIIFCIRPIWTVKVSNCANRIAEMVSDSINKSIRSGDSVSGSARSSITYLMIYLDNCSPKIWSISTSGTDLIVRSCPWVCAIAIAVQIWWDFELRCLSELRMVLKSLSQMSHLGIMMIQVLIWCRMLMTCFW